MDLCYVGRQVVALGDIAPFQGHALMILVVSLCSWKSKTYIDRTKILSKSQRFLNGKCSLHEKNIKAINYADNFIYYPTLLPRVQISREKRLQITDICTRLIPPGRVKFKTLASQNFGKRNRWIINLLLDVLLCSIAVYFYSLFVFWLALRACQNTAQLVKIYSDTT